MPVSEAFPWESAMKFGLGVLKLSPLEFWAMTPRELQAAYSAHAQTSNLQTPIARPKFENLMKKFPDKDKPI